jgi:hypothetical protein
MDLDFGGGAFGDDMGFNFDFNAGGDMPAPTPDRRRILQTPRSKTKNANKGKCLHWD